MPSERRSLSSSSTAVWLVSGLVLFGMALLVAGARLTAQGSGVADSARLLRQTRFTPAGGAAAGISGVAAATATAGSAGSTDVAAPLASAASSVIVGGCLITKWSAVWLVHADRHTRSHVSMPTSMCDLHASETEDIERYVKAHGGTGAYSLDE